VDAIRAQVSGNMTHHGRPHVLMVEDEEAIRDLVAFHLKLSDFDFTAVGNGTDALRLAGERPFDVILLDILLPGIDGITVCQAVRREGPNRETPILMLTARSEESDRVVGLESGADDYLTKPFGVRELLARLKALLRRSTRMGERAAPRTRELPVVSQLGVTIDPTRRRVTVDDRVVTLTPQEFSLLYLLASHPGTVFDREELLARVWEDEVFVTVRGVDTLVKRLRRKIEADPSQPTRVVTTRGAGYKFSES
jgi:DNA-binding response OmpR family regulator